MKIEGVDSATLERVSRQGSRPPLKEVQLPGRKHGPGPRNRVAGEPPAVLNEGTFLEELEEGIKKLNDTARAFNLSLRFLLHQDSERWMVQVVDRKENEVIREIPPEQVLNVVAQIQNMIGILLDERR